MDPRGLVLDDAYSAEFGFLLYDEVIRNNPHAKRLILEEKRTYSKRVTKKQKILLGNLMVFDKIYAHTDALEMTLQGTVYDKSRYEELEDIIVNKNVHFQKLVNRGTIQNVNSLGRLKSDKNGLTTPWYPGYTDDSYSDRYSLFSEYQSLFGSLLRDRGLLKSANDFKDYLRQIKGVALYGDSSSFLGPKRFLFDWYIFRFSSSMITSWNQEIPMLTDITSVGSFGDSTQTFGEDINKFVSIILKEVTHFPQPRSIDEALELKDHLLVQQFRTALLSWIEALLNNEQKDEAVSREELKRINSLFSRLNWCGKVSKYVTYLSLPGLIADLVISGGFVGITGLVLGIGSQVLTDNAKQRISSRFIGLK